MKSLGIASHPLGGIPIPNSAFAIRRAMTMVELLIVIVVILIVMNGILVASTSVLNRSRINNTQTVLQLVADAAEEFKREKPTVTLASQAGSGRTITYAKRYGSYPPDELEVFTEHGLPGSRPPASRSLGPGGAKISPGSAGALSTMKFYAAGNPDKMWEHRDILAFVVAVETLTESASAILDKIPARYRTEGPLTEEAEPKPAMFLDRDANNRWDAADFQIRPIVDAWGIPVSYLSQQDWSEGGSSAPSSNHPAWNEASTEFLRINGGQPIIFSYGPDGRDQLTQQAMGNDGRASLVGDFEYNDDHVVNNPFNDDNVYLNPAMKAKLAKGIAP